MPMSTTPSLDVKVPVSDLDPQEAKTPQQNHPRQGRKRKRDDEPTSQNYAAVVCMPEKYIFPDARSNTVSRMIFDYFRNLQQNDCVARPRNWSQILHSASTHQKKQQPPLQHPWNNLCSIHYDIVRTSIDFQRQLDSGLLLPVYIPPESELGREISFHSVWAQQPIGELLDEILKDRKSTIQVQDHGLESLEVFTVEKKCKEVRARFFMSPDERGDPWNCLEIEDRLPGHKGPKPLEHGANLRSWQLTDPSPTSMNRSQFAPLPGAKQVDRWLLISEQRSGSTAHMDIGFATWVSCLAGKKTFWLRNPSIRDQKVWDDFDIGDDHRLFAEPWGRTDLYPGSILVFPPGTIHAVYTEEDSVFCGGHFLTPQVMDRFLEVLGQTELDPSRTNDLKNVDLFRILENFIQDALSLSLPGLTKAQLHQFVVTLEKYISLEPRVRTEEDWTENEHMERRQVFLKRLRKKKWIASLQRKVESMSWESF